MDEQELRKCWEWYKHTEPSRESLSMNDFFDLTDPESSSIIADMWAAWTAARALSASELAEKDAKIAELKLQLGAKPDVEPNRRAELLALVCAVEARGGRPESVVNRARMLLTALDTVTP